MEDVAFYANKKDIVDQLSTNQLKELDKAIEEADKKETISWNDFKKEMKEWKKSSYLQTLPQQYSPGLPISS